jgi:hypothetical protein
MNEPLVQYEIEGLDFQAYRAPNTQLLKWIGNKQRFAEAIASHFPRRFGTFIEPFMGSGAVLATVAPTNGIGADVFSPLIDIWQTLKPIPIPSSIGMPTAGTGSRGRAKEKPTPECYETTTPTRTEPIFCF